ncbi:50S ribosomal protein L1 [Candidatus Phytoplasma melaleucae]|uniref:Large ribosomal subunit protein uL1 n=1 Tax=Candidatus Phytoplasma melaleucae TaxID=2982630 RepID=A0ABT9DDS3_9MOLU|nr:50S ribosomal protein L1 ['Melaleuca sp.' phytoplasma]MDO8168182.1 50S ribosomal protein L1 ['Melaleuca sp.' phytoplasma]MDV3205424.1 50S ribosomal protein L1 [Weeping tea tree witches'-broom phytoplasma]
MKRSKKYLSMCQMINFHKLYAFTDAIELVKKTQITQFDSTVECNFALNLNTKQLEQNLRGALVLPHGSGKKLKVAVLAKGGQAKEAKEAKADYIGDQDLIDKITANWLEFDVLVATPELMSGISKLGRILGPKGLMPNPKLGTVTNEIFKIVQEIKKGRIEYKTDKAGNLHTILGKVSFSLDQLIDNFKFLYEHLLSIKPKTVKGNFIKNVTLSSTMSPGIKVDCISIR